MILEDTTKELMTAYEVDCYMTVLDYRFIGRHWQYKIYGNGYDRISFEKKSNYKGIKYREHSQYIGKEYIEPLHFDDFLNPPK